MFCPKCGSEVNNEEKICQNCGLDLKEIEKEENKLDYEKKESIQNEHVVLAKENEDSNGFIKGIYFLLAIIILCIFFWGAYKVGTIGNDMSEIESISGDSIAEVYYQDLGKIYVAFAMLIRGIGIFFAAVLIKLGLMK
ncbi:MAG: hypothetical protein K5851_06825 [Lachnospiraceae bacterium]|nr:hypothetical protein [Lachnospiraceae bacterium]